MTGRSPARLLAPLALVAAAVALFAVIGSGNRGESGESRSSAEPPSATATPAARSKEKKKPSKPETYTVKPGDTPIAIAEELDVEVDALLEANPDVDAGALTVGDKLEVP